VKLNHALGFEKLNPLRDLFPLVEQNRFLQVWKSVPLQERLNLCSALRSFLQRIVQRPGLLQLLKLSVVTKLEIGHQCRGARVPITKIQLPLVDF
jgi:hypothetical protein